MGYLHSRSRLSAIIFLVFPTFFTLSAFAAGYQINEVSPSLQGSATAGAAATNNDVSALFANPATLSTLKTNQAYIGGSEIIPSIRVSNASGIHTVNIPGLPLSNITAPALGVTSQNNISKAAFVPDAYVSWRINPKLVAGLALVAPFGLTTKYYGNSVLRFVAVNSSVMTININPAIAYTLNDRWAFGLGLQAQYMQAIFSNFNGPYTGDPDIDALVAANNPTYLKADGWGYGYTLGALYTPDACTRIGLGFRSQISQQLTGNGQQYVSPGRTVPGPSHDFLFNAQTRVNGAVKTPAVLILSATRDMDKWTLKATAQMNFWHTFNHLSINMPDAFGTNSTIQTRWQNAWFAALGADYRATCDWTVRAGVAYDQTPTVDTYRDPRIPDASRVWATVGATYLLNKQFSVDGAFAHIFMKNQNVNVTQASGSSANSTVPLEVNHVHANYTGYANIVALALRYNF